MSSQRIARVDLVTFVGDSWGLLPRGGAHTHSKPFILSARELQRDFRWDRQDNLINREALNLTVLPGRSNFSEWRRDGLSHSGYSELLQIPSLGQPLP